jgi:hypothetical protein
MMSDSLEARLLKELGELKGMVGRIGEKSEENSRKLDGIGNCLKAHDERLRKLERVADKGTGALKAVLWIGGGVLTIISLAAAVARAAGWSGKGG